MSYNVIKGDTVFKKEKSDLERKRYEYMLSWRNKKIELLEEQIRGYNEVVKICYSIIASLVVGKEGNIKKISKAKLSKALEKKYSITCDDKYYYIKCGGSDGEN